MVLKKVLVLLNSYRLYSIYVTEYNRSQIICKFHYGIHLQGSTPIDLYKCFDKNQQVCNMISNTLLSLLCIGMTF